MAEMIINSEYQHHNICEAGVITHTQAAYSPLPCSLVWIQSWRPARRHQRPGKTCRSSCPAGLWHPSQGWKGGKRGFSVTLHISVLISFTGWLALCVCVFLLLYFKLHFNVKQVFYKERNHVEWHNRKLHNRGQFVINMTSTRTHTSHSVPVHENQIIPEQGTLCLGPKNFDQTASIKALIHMQCMGQLIYCLWESGEAHVKALTQYNQFYNGVLCYLSTS